KGDVMKKAKDAVLEALARASKGLRFLSETDAGFEPFAWKDGDALTKGRLLQLAGEGAGTAVEPTSLRTSSGRSRPRTGRRPGSWRGRGGGGCGGSRSTRWATRPRGGFTSSARRGTAAGRG